MTPKYQVYWKAKGQSDRYLTRIGSSSSYSFFKDYYTDINEAFAAANSRAISSGYTYNEYVVKEMQ